MKVPKKIRVLIKQIEKYSCRLAQSEKELYEWIEKNRDRYFRSDRFIFRDSVL